MEQGFTSEAPLEYLQQEGHILEPIDTCLLYKREGALGDIY